MLYSSQASSALGLEIKLAGPNEPAYIDVCTDKPRSSANQRILGVGQPQSNTRRATPASGAQADKRTKRRIRSNVAECLELLDFVHPSKIIKATGFKRLGEVAVRDVAQQVDERCGKVERTPIGLGAHKVCIRQMLVKGLEEFLKVAWFPLC